MSLFKRKPPETEAQQFARAHPYGEEGSPEYWQEAMRRAYESGCGSAMAEIWKLDQMPAQSVLRWMDFPDWFANIWIERLAPYHDVKEHPLRMPY